MHQVNTKQSTILSRPLARLERRPLEEHANQGPTHCLRTDSQTRSRATRFGRLVGVSPRMQSIFTLLLRAAQTNVTCLLNGQTGTGKSIAAQEIHNHSSRCEGNFVTVDCTSIPENLLESTLFGHEKGAFTGAVTKQNGALLRADGGTLFLDEIGELPLELQAKLLHVLETRTVRPIGSDRQFPVDFRLLVATHRDLKADTQAQRFREDLYYRIAVVKIAFPSLRERPEDIGLIVNRLLDRLGASHDDRRMLCSESTLTLLARGPWPGNVRELRNYLQRAMFYQRVLPLEDVAATCLEVPSSHTPMRYSEARREALLKFDAQYIQSLMQAHDGNVSQAAQSAGMHRVSLHRLIRNVSESPLLMHGVNSVLSPA